MNTKNLGKHEIRQQIAVHAAFAAKEKANMSQAITDTHDVLYYHHLGICLGLHLALGLEHAAAHAAAHESVRQAGLSYDQRDMPF